MGVQVVAEVGVSSGNGVRRSDCEGKGRGTRKESRGLAGFWRAPARHVLHTQKSKSSLLDDVVSHERCFLQAGGLVAFQGDGRAVCCTPEVQKLQMNVSISGRSRGCVKVVGGGGGLRRCFDVWERR